MKSHESNEQNFPPRDVPGIHRPAMYRIQVVGRLSEALASNFGDMRVTTVRSQSGEPVTELAGRVPDQAGLFGLLGYIRDFGLPLILVEYLPGCQD